MTIAEFKQILLSAIKNCFPEADIVIKERRTVVLEARVEIDEETFVNVYFNALTNRKSYALIFRGERVMGYNNYKFWHYHPFGSPEKHVRCQEPKVGKVFKEMKEAVRSLRLEGREK
jgi:hypothetical protein